MIFWYNFLSLLIPLTTSEETFEFFKSRCDSKCTLQPYHIDSESISLFPIDCSSVCAYILIDQNSDLTENQLKNYFRNMRTLYGSVKIKDTNFPSLNFLSRLETIECVPVQLIGIINNPNLANATFPKLKKIQSDNKFLMIFQGNHPVLLKDPNFCKSIKKQLNSTEWHAPSVDGKSCEEIEDAQSSNNQIGVLLVVMITMILLVF
ncbi:hypothetical protein L5515_006841 [Caenorhabditis briggsae]|uniref:Receptor L-domain domain-containing protein n=1 Tax=Caenorhabditis briggsae TaxID=6238 RepID=A0AAE9F0D0_CAEBR|nr:hypothetical protein L5515_006841 [Caenorhabditis briggsae]